MQNCIKCDSNLQPSSDDSLIAHALELGGIVSRVVDLDTGEIAEPAPRRADVRSTAGASLRGLSNVHISRKPASLTIWKDGGLIKASRSGHDRVAPVPGKRGEVETMSRASRRRLMYKLGMIKRDTVPIFATLTYPGLYTGDVRSCKRNLDTFAHRLEYLGAAAIWRLEHKVRRTGASEGEAVPHFHMLVWLPNGMTLWEFQRWISRSWYEVVGSGSADHLEAGTSCEVMRSWRGVMSYAAKYICKEDLDAVPKGCGRMWGIVNRKLIPWAEAETIVVTNEQCLAAYGYFESYAGSIWREECASRLLLCDSPEQVRKNVLMLSALARHDGELVDS